MAELDYQSTNWSHPRRLVRIRHEVGGDSNRGGKRWIEVAGYRFQALAVRRYFHGRADCESVIQELRPGFAQPP